MALMEHESVLAGAGPIQPITVFFETRDGGAEPFTIDSPKAVDAAEFVVRVAAHNEREELEDGKVIRMFGDITTQRVRGLLEILMREEDFPDDTAAQTGEAPEVLGSVQA